VKTPSSVAKEQCVVLRVRLVSNLFRFGVMEVFSERVAGFFVNLGEDCSSQGNSFLLIFDDPSSLIV